MTTKLDSAKNRAMALADAWIVKVCEHIESIGQMDPEDRALWLQIVGSLGGFTLKINYMSKIVGTPEERLRAVEMTEIQLMTLCKEIAEHIASTVTQIPEHA